VASSSMTLFSFVSLCVTRSGMSPESINLTMVFANSSRAQAKPISSATDAALPQRSARACAKNVWKRLGVLWKSGRMS